MVCIALNNWCIAENHQCESRWQLEVQQLDLIQVVLVCTLKVRYFTVSLVVTANLSSVAARQFSRLTKTSVYVFSSVSIQGLKFFGSVIFFLFSSFFLILFSQMMTL